MAEQTPHPGPLVRDPGNIRLAMIGMVEGNGHPYSWSAIINGSYDAAAMAECGYPVIPQYLDAQPREALGIPGASVTHVWCDNPDDAAKVARACRIPNVPEHAADVIGAVDAAIIATDIGGEHVHRARPFIEAGLPVFIDKPLCDTPADLQQFAAWQQRGCPMLSTSCMRYAREYAVLREDLAQAGELRLITVTMAKSWERYGIHGLEAIYPMLPAGGYQSVTHGGTEKANLMRIAHASGVETVLCVIDDLYGAFGHVHAYGTAGACSAVFSDTFGAFKAQLTAMTAWLRTGHCPVPFEETAEQMKIIIAGIRSRSEGGRTVYLNEIEG